MAATTAATTPSRGSLDGAFKEELPVTKSVNRVFFLTPLVALPIGVVFGMALQSSGMPSPAIIRSQFLFERQIMLRVFLAGVAGSGVTLATLEWLFPQEFAEARQSKGSTEHIPALVGGLLQGVGMAVAGTCPGMVLAQVGAGVENAPLGYLGGLAGALAFSVLHPYMFAYPDHEVQEREQAASDATATAAQGSKDKNPLTWFSKFKAFLHGLPYGSTALTLSATCLAAAMAVDLVVPWKSDIAGVAGLSPATAQNPVAMGLLIGSLQLPAFVGLGQFLGNSAAYSVLTSQLLTLCPVDSFPSLSYARSMISSRAWWQIYSGIGLALGAAYVANVNLVEHAQMSPRGVSPVEAFLGTFVLVFGARLAGGCATGHGITGLAKLSEVSWVVVPSMFAGGIATALLMSSILGRDAFLLQ